MRRHTNELLDQLYEAGYVHPEEIGRTLASPFAEIVEALCLAAGIKDVPEPPERLSSQEGEAYRALIEEQLNSVGAFDGTKLPGEIGKARFMHEWVIGPTGSGKTTLLETQLVVDLAKVVRGEASVVVIDSQGSGKDRLIGDLLRLEMFAPGQPLHDKLIYLEPDPEHPLALNILDVPMPRHASTREREVYEASAVELITFCLSSLSEQQSELFEFAARLLIKIKNPRLTTLFHIFEEDGWKRYEKYLDDEDAIVRRFFTETIKQPGMKPTREAAHRRLMGLLSNPTFRRMLEAPRNKFNMYEELKTPKVILIQTDRDLLKRHACEMFGRFFIGQLLHASEMRGSDALPVYCYIDECSDYVSNDLNIAELLAKARKRHIGLVLSHQNLAQITADTVRAALADCAIRFAGGNETDAGILSRVLHSDTEAISRAKTGTFISYIRGVTPAGVSIRVPQVMQRMPRMGEGELADIRHTMHERYGRTEEAEEPQRPSEPPASRTTPRDERDNDSDSNTDPSPTWR